MFAMRMGQSAMKRIDCCQMPGIRSLAAGVQPFFAVLTMRCR